MEIEQRNMRGSEETKMICVSVAKKHRDDLEILDEYAEAWDCSRSKALFKMVSKYNYLKPAGKI